MIKKRTGRRLLIIGIPVLLTALVYSWTVMRTKGRTIIQFDVRQNKELIHLSAFAEPPQFAIWIENYETGAKQTVFVTHRAGAGDWEGKANVPVALPRWVELFNKNNVDQKGSDPSAAEHLAVTGATPREDYFSIRVEVPPHSRWICWIEMNLSGDYNEAFPELDIARKYEDEFGCGQPALLYRAEIIAMEGLEVEPELYAQSIWENGINRVEPVSEGVTTAKDVFDQILLSVSRPKPKLVTHLYRKE